MSPAKAKLQQFLNTRFLEIQTKNPSFSLRAFAKKLGLSPGATCELLQGQRQASKKVAERIAKNLLLDPQETFELLKHYEADSARRRRPTPEAALASKDYLKLTSDQFRIISDWVHYAILSLVETKDFESSSEWIADRLGVTPAKIEASLERLLRLELLERDALGKLVRTHAQIHTSDDLFSVSLQKAHIEDMELAKEAIQRVPVALRDYTSISLPADPALLGEAKKLIRAFRGEVTKLLQSKPGTEVYQMSVYLYPLTKPRKEPSQ